VIRFNAMVNILISPVEGGCGFVVLLDVTKELSGQVSFGSEDSSSNDSALNFGEPDFDLVEPTRIGRRVMEPNCRIGVKELKNTLGFVRAQVVGHDMNFSARRLAGHDRAQKVDKFDAGMPVGGLTDDVAGASIKCCIQ